VNHSALQCTPSTMLENMIWLTLFYQFIITLLICTLHSMMVHDTHQHHIHKIHHCLAPQQNCEITKSAKTVSVAFWGLGLGSARTGAFDLHELDTLHIRSLGQQLISRSMSNMAQTALIMEGWGQRGSSLHPTYPINNFHQSYLVNNYGVQ